MKILNWNKQGLKGKWDFTYKIDGVRGHWNSHTKSWVSRSGKTLYNLPIPSKGEVFEIFLGSFKETIQQTRTKNKSFLIPLTALYSLKPIDPRLYMCYINNPSKEIILELLNNVNKLGYEGLVLRQEDTWIKVKPEETYDVSITSFLEGKGKYKDTLGALETSMGKVGTGFTDEERRLLWNERANLLNTIVEVSCLHLTEANKFRHPRFIRLRPDK